MLFKTISFFILFFYAKAQDATFSCNYTMATIEGVQRYTCRAIFDNVDGFDDFTEISGNNEIFQRISNFYSIILYKLKILFSSLQVPTLKE